MVIISIKFGGENEEETRMEAQEEEQYRSAQVGAGIGMQCVAER